MALAVLWTINPQQAVARVPAAQMCDQAAMLAATESGVPLDVLQSITRTETGRTRNGTLQPWPWTVNMEGVGKWFETEDAARAYVFNHFKRGARSFDVGCFQINYRWHGDAFRSIDQMFDPLENARYAADFLNRLYAETGDWSEAAGAYHSRTPKYATRYRSRFDDIRNQIAGASDASTPSILTGAMAKPLRENRFPLLQGGAQSSSHGSLVPLTNSGGLVLIVMPSQSGGS